MQLINLKWLTNLLLQSHNSFQNLTIFYQKSFPLHDLIVNERRSNSMEGTVPEDNSGTMSDEPRGPQKPDDGRPAGKPLTQADNKGPVTK